MWKTLKGAAVIFLALSVLAMGPARAELSEADRAEIARVEAYVNGVTTLQGTILAIDSRSTQAIGRLWIQRPDKVRVDFGPPRGLLAIVNDGDIDYFDPSVRRSSSIPVSVTPLEPLFADRITLTGEITVTEVQLAGNLLHLTAVSADDPDAGHAIITFTYDPLELRQWTVIDTEGEWIRFVLLDANWGVPLERKLFWWVDPN